MKLSISKKFAKRSIKCLALFAPIAYLFGSLFFGLNGAHGAFPYSADYEVVVGDDGYVLNQQVPDSDFSIGSYWNSNSPKATLTISNNIARSTQNTVASSWYENGLTSTYDTYTTSGHMYFYRYFVESNIAGSYTFYNSNLGYGGNTAVSANSKTAVYGVLRSFRTDGSVNLLLCRSGTSLSVGDYSDYSNFVLVDLTLMYGEGLEPDANTFNTWLGDSYIAFDRYGTYVSVPVYGTPDNSQYVFNQFFAKDNFLQQWGENAISDNPKGFAPFGAFFKFIDENMLHLSDSQIGLMGYGYIYYCLHILIAFLAFDCVAFIPQLIMKVIHQFNKGVDSDD